MNISTQIEQQLLSTAQTAPIGTIVHPDEQFIQSLTQDQAQAIASHFAQHLLMKLPKREQEFFEWLRQNDLPVWNDLWGDCSGDELYVVSIAFLPLLCDPVRGFPICDLLSVDNYYFVPDHLFGPEAPFFIEAVKERFLNQEKLTIAQLLALEIHMGPIDIWRFAWHHRLSLEQCRKAVEQLGEDKLLLHLRKAEELAGFVQFSYE
jgi:hypothetical protein